MEVVRIRREGFPIREYFRDFLHRTENLHKYISAPDVSDDKALVQIILAKYLSPSDYRESSKLSTINTFL
jgi:myosin heavy subunit